MGKVTREEYRCDKCGKKLPTHSNTVAIVTPMTEDYENPWSRLRVMIEHHHGMHNDAHVDKADLCQRCVIALLTDALKRVKAGERVSSGVETSHLLKFNQAF